MKIIELTIDEFEGFVDVISLVERPAHESNFFWFSSVEKPKEIYEVLNEEQMSELAFALSQLGETYKQMEEDGYYLYKIEDALPTPELFYSSNPNPAGENEYNPRVRYGYSHPLPAGRIFCEELLKANRIYTEMDLLELSNLNPVGPGGYSVLNWRGSYNCRGKWKKLTFLPKIEGGDLLNKTTANRRQLIQEETGVLYDTRTDDTKAAAARGTRANGQPISQWKPGVERVGGFSEQFSLIDIVDDIPVFERKEDADIFAEIIGCSGSHEHNINGVIGYMPCSAEEMSHTDCNCKDGYVSDGFSCVPVDNEKMVFSTDDEKMEITGAAMIPNKLIIRKTEGNFMNPQGEFYYVFFTEQTIRKLADKFMESKLLDSTNIEHNSNVKADTYVKESWIIENPEMDKTAALGLDLPKGTWMITMKVKNKDVWNKIKQGVLNGYSVEGWFAENLLFR